jgi:DNA-binding NarL/FixJ family response regulator
LKRVTGRIQERLAARLEERERLAHELHDMLLQGFIILTTYQGDVQAMRAIRAGASGYLLKNMLRKDLLDTIRVVYAGKRIIPLVIASGLAQHMADDALSQHGSICCEAWMQEIPTNSSQQNPKSLKRP